MVGFYQGPVAENATQIAAGVDALETGPGEVLGAVVADTLARSPTWRGMRAARTVDGPAPGLEFAPPGDIAPFDSAPRLEPTEATQRYGIPGVLKFDAPVSEAVAKDIHDAKREALVREDLIRRRADSVMTGMVARTGAALAAGMLDPINLAAGFIPVVGPARAAAMVASAGSALARGGVRAAIGATQGAVSMVPLEALSYGLDRHYHDDWHMSEALANIAFGGLIGGGLHVAMRYPRAPISQMIEGAGHDARVGMLRAGIAQHVGDQPINVAPILDTAELESALAARLRARGDTADGHYAAYTPTGQRVELRPEVVELSSLIASHDANGVINPAYPHAEGTQPRGRDSPASRAQVREMASRLEPERLGPSPEASAGAPIVNPDNVVESGNGRTMALTQVYTDPLLAAQAQAYRAYLRARGHDVEGMRQPVLIGRRMNTLTQEEQRAFAVGANERSTLGFNAAEQAGVDRTRAARAAPAFVPGALTSKANEGFISAFMRGMTVEERAGMMRTDGTLSPAGATRIRGAMLGHAYGDALGPTLERLLDGDVAHMRGIAAALNEMAGEWSRFRAAIASGDIPASVDITPAIGEVVRLMDRAHDLKITPRVLMQQLDMLDRPSAAADALLRALTRNESMTQEIASTRTVALLRDYLDQAMRARPGPDMFGAPEVTAADIMRVVGGENERLQAVAAAMRSAVGPEAGVVPEYAAASQAAERVAAEAKGSRVGDGAHAELPPLAATAEENPVARGQQLRRLAPEQADVLNALYERAMVEKPAFDATIGRLAAEQGGDAILAPLKSTRRTVDKIVADYAGDAGRIRDILRASIAVDTPDQAAAVLRRLEHEFPIDAAGRRTTLLDDTDAGVYRDIKVVANLGEGFYAEIQVHLRALLQAKKHGHPMYEERQAIRRAAVADSNRMLSDAERLRLAELETQEGHFYEDAWARIRSTQAQKASAEMGAPLRSAEPGSNDLGGNRSQAIDGDTGPSNANLAGTSDGARSSETGNAPSKSKNFGLSIDGTPEANLRFDDGLNMAVVSPEIQEARRSADKVVAELRAEIAAGRMTEADLGGLRAADDGLAKAQDRAQAAQAAAACLIATGGGA